jgi:branched-chain amino acid transport system permease protein
VTPVLVVCGIAALLVLPQVGGEGYFTHMAVTMLIFSMLASSLNLSLGYTGLVSVAHAAFFGIGAYTSGNVVLRLRLSFWVALVLAGLVTMVVAAAIGIPSFRTRGVYYIIVTVAFQMIMSELFDNWYSMTQGGLGLRGIPRPSPMFQSRVSYYYLVLGVALVVHVLLARTIRSPVGRALMAIRDNETRAQMMGLNIRHFKILAFTLSAGVAGLAGSLYAHYMEYANPEFFNFAVSVDVYLMVIVGGAGTIAGPIVGVLFVEILRELLHGLVALRLVLFGVMLIVLITFLPGGIVKAVTEVTKKRTGRRPAIAVRATR